ncbi:MAG: hypothetical protein AAF441_20880 [Pseudomonadota bacterium]
MIRTLPQIIPQAVDARKFGSCPRRFGRQRCAINHRLSEAPNKPVVEGKPSVLTKLGKSQLKTSVGASVGPSAQSALNLIQCGVFPPSLASVSEWPNAKLRSFNRPTKVHLTLLSEAVMQHSAFRGVALSSKQKKEFADRSYPQRIPPPARGGVQSKQLAESRWRVGVFSAHHPWARATSNFKQSFPIQLAAIMAAVIGFGTLIATLIQIQEDIASKTIERENLRRDRIERAWDRILIPVSGNTRKGEAISYLLSEGVDLTGIDVSCQRTGNWNANADNTRWSLMPTIHLQAVTHNSLHPLV